MGSSHKREKPRSEMSDNDFRNEYENDYDRVIFSAPFRRLQDKAQVFPLERNDFVRTRLTHSMEVAAIARSIGVSVFSKLLRNNVIDNCEYTSFIPMILETAGLAHDIGNPPFGHFGEETIRKTFQTWFEQHKEFILNDEEKRDLLYFDGNCQMFRVLTHLQCIKDEYGLHLTYATLATLMKYPFDSIEGNRDKKFCEENGIFYKKFGYFCSEKELAKAILYETKLRHKDSVYRHPLAFILEAADDIAYSAGDLEDGFKKRLFSFTDIQEYFDIEKAKSKCMREACKEVKNIIYGDKYYSDEKKLQDIRIVLQSIMIQKVVDAFVDNYYSIMNKEFKGELLYASDAKEIRENLKKMSDKYILSNLEIEKIELGGEKVIRYLVERFMEAFANQNFIEYIVNQGEDKISGSQKRMYDLISEDFRKVFENKVNLLKSQISIEEGLFNRIYYYICIMVVDYISGMTDNYCTDLYKRLQGIGNI